MADETSKPPTTGPLKRSLTLPMLTLYGLGVTVGAGIYVLIGETASLAGTFAPVAFIMAAITVAFTAFSYAELSTRIPVAAGVAAYVHAGLRRNDLSLILGLAVAVSGVVSAAAVAIGAGNYMQGLLGLPAPVMTAFVVVSMGLIAWWGVTESVIVAGVVTVVEVSGLALVIYWGFGVSDGGHIAFDDLVPAIVGPHWVGIGAATILAFFAFVGFEDIVNVVEEVKDPRRTLPRAIIATLLVATLLYVSVCLAVLWAIPLHRLAGAEAPLLMVFEGAPIGVQTTFASIAVVATVNGVLIQIIMASRVLYGMGSRGQLPTVLAKVSVSRRTPWVATIVVVGVILVLSAMVPIAVLAGGTSQIVLTIFVFVNMSLVAIKLRDGPSQDAFVVPIALPVLGLLTSIGLLLLSFA